MGQAGCIVYLEYLYTYIYVYIKEMGPINFRENLGYMRGVRERKGKVFPCGGICHHVTEMEEAVISWPLAPPKVA